MVKQDELCLDDWSVAIVVWIMFAFAFQGSPVATDSRWRWWIRSRTAWMTCWATWWKSRLRMTLDARFAPCLLLRTHSLVQTATLWKFLLFYFYVSFSTHEGKKYFFAFCTTERAHSSIPRAHTPGNGRISGEIHRTTRSRLRRRGQCKCFSSLCDFYFTLKRMCITWCTKYDKYTFHVCSLPCCSWHMQIWPSTTLWYEVILWFLRDDLPYSLCTTLWSPHHHP